MNPVLKAMLKMQAKFIFTLIAATLLILPGCETLKGLVGLTETGQRQVTVIGLEKSITAAYSITLQGLRLGTITKSDGGRIVQLIDQANDTLDRTRNLILSGDPRGSDYIETVFLILCGVQKILDANNLETEDMQNVGCGALAVDSGQLAAA